jgi:hypothetical protein
MDERHTSASNRQREKGRRDLKEEKNSIDYL